MDLRYNGQYRMIGLNSFFLVGNSIDDFMLVSGTMEKIYQLQVKYDIDPTITHTKGDILTI